MIVPPLLSFTLHVTVESLAPLTVAVKDCVWPVFKVTAAGEIVIVTSLLVGFVVGLLFVGFARFTVTDLPVGLPEVQAAKKRIPTKKVFDCIVELHLDFIFFYKIALFDGLLAKLPPDYLHIAMSWKLVKSIEGIERLGLTNPETSGGYSAKPFNLL